MVLPTWGEVWLNVNKNKMLLLLKHASHVFDWEECKDKISLDETEVLPYLQKVGTAASELRGHCVHYG